MFQSIFDRIESLNFMNICIVFSIFNFIHIFKENYKNSVNKTFESLKKQKTKTPSNFWTSIPMWALIITHFGQNWAFLTILSLLTTYFQKILLLDIESLYLYILNKTKLKTIEN